MEPFSSLSRICARGIVDPGSGAVPDFAAAREDCRRILAAAVPAAAAADWPGYPAGDAAAARETLTAALESLTATCPECARRSRGDDNSRWCPVCGNPAGEGAACQVCGAELDLPALRFDPETATLFCPVCGTVPENPGTLEDYPAAAAYLLLLLGGLRREDAPDASRFPAYFPVPAADFTGADRVNAEILAPGSLETAGAAAWRTLESPDWLRLLYLSAGAPSPVLAACPWDFSPEDLGRLLTAWPACGDLCPWESFSDDRWREIIPWDGGRLGTHAGTAVWERLLRADAALGACAPADVWRELLARDPAAHAPRCHWETLADPDLDAFARAHPELCAVWSPREWRRLLAVNPELAARLLDAPAAAAVIAACPAAAGVFSAERWLEFLDADPERFLPLCPAEILTPERRLEILERHPRAVSAVFSADIWLELLRTDAGRTLRLLPAETVRRLLDSPRHREFQALWPAEGYAELLAATPLPALQRCDQTRLNPEALEKIIGAARRRHRLPPPPVAVGGGISVIPAAPAPDRPDTAGFRAVAAALTGDSWRRLLLAHPENISCAPVENLAPADWGELLAAHPEWQDRCHVWKAFTPADWDRLCAARPEFRRRAAVFTAPDSATLAAALAEHPDMADDADLTRLGPADWLNLLAGGWDLFSARCPWEKLLRADWDSIAVSPRRDAIIPHLAEPASRLPAGERSRFLLTFPETLSAFPPESLRSLPPGHWRRWAEDNAPLAEHIPWEDLPRDVTAELWRNQPAVRPGIRRHYRRILDGELGGERLAELIVMFPGIVDRPRPDAFGCLDVEQWHRVLAVSPELGRYCAARRATELLLAHPEDVRKLRREVLNTIIPGTWLSLVTTHPSLVPYCDFHVFNPQQLQWLAGRLRIPEVSAPARRLLDKYRSRAMIAVLTMAAVALFCPPWAAGILCFGGGIAATVIAQRMPAVMAPAVPGIVFFVTFIIKMALLR